MLSEMQIKKIRGQLKRKYNERLPLIFNALGDHCRFCIFLLLLLQHEICVTDVAKICKITLSAASQQLKTLELSGIVLRERRGQIVCYVLKEKDPVIKIIKTLSKISSL